RMPFTEHLLVDGKALPVILYCGRGVAMQVFHGPDLAVNLGNPWMPLTRGGNLLGQRPLETDSCFIESAYAHVRLCNALQRTRSQDRVTIFRSIRQSQGSRVVLTRAHEVILQEVGVAIGGKCA